MESPVMTSASSHRLRSAVGACAQPTHSYLNSSYLSTSIKVESHDSGGCFKKFRTGKNGESLPLNVNKKSHTAEFLPLYKRQKLAHKNNLSHQRAKASGKEIENSSTNRVLDLIPKQFMIGNDFLSKLKLNGKFLEPKRLAEYLDKAARHETVVDNCEKVIDGKSSLNSSKKSNGSCNNNNNNNNNNSSSSSNNNSNNNNNNNNSDNNKKILNRHNNCNKGRSKHQKSLTAPNKDSINGEIVRSDNCAVHLDKGIKNERQEILNWQPKHVVTRRTAQIFRPIRNAWQKQVESSKYAPAEKSSQLFCDLQQFPSVSQVTEMLEYSKECPCNPTANVTVPYNEYFRINSSIIEFKDARSSPIRRSRDKNVKKRTRKFSKGMNKYEVFLGGSCNPTTWRTDFAIPELEKVGITYYNPQQVDEWRPELLEKEYHAKENAIVMFFVLDNQTRGVSALIEVAHLAGNQRKLILVIQSYTQKNQIICDEQISKEEYEDLKTGQDVLQTLVERQGIPVFDDIQKALKCTEKVLRENLRVQDLQAPAVRVSRENSISPEDVFEKLDSSDSGEISASDVCLALRMLTGIQISTDHLNSLIVKGGRSLNGTLLDDVKFDRQHFSELVSQFREQLQDGMFSDLPTSFTWYGKDVYLGGTIEHTSWRESIAIPALEAQNLSFFVPKINEKGKRFTEIEAAAMDNSFVLLFVITKTARSIAAMAIAGHYIGKGAKVVLCVEHLPENAIINEELLSECAVKDYNRGRMYLMDIAERSDVPVFNDISKAVNFVVEKCRNR